MVGSLANALVLIATAAMSEAPLPSWSDGAAKQAILNFVKTTTDNDSSHLPASEDRYQLAFLRGEVLS